MGKTAAVKYESRPREDLLIRFFGDCSVTVSNHTEVLSSFLDLHIAEVMPTDNLDRNDEVSLLNFYPVEDGKYYLQLTFIPEPTNKAGDHYRVIQLTFRPDFFHQWPDTLICKKQPFRCDRTTEQAFSLNSTSREVLDIFNQFKPGEQHDLIVMLKRQEAAISLLRFALEAFMVPDEANKFPACSFLSNTREREKVMDAQRIILNNLDQPLTIRELSREVGMNECYLKKGFKAMFGKTIHEYLQYQRIEQAKELLQQKNLTVNEVAFRLGFGSASHFSTSFKKIAGIKPCELLS